MSDGEDAELARWELPLDLHPKLVLDTDYARLSIVALEPGETPFLEAIGRDASGFDVEVDGSGGTTRVHVSGRGFGDGWWGGKWWEGKFWDARGKKKGHRARLVVHVPASVHAKVRASAAKLHVSGLHDCDLDLATDAGQINLEDVGGRLTIRTDAGKIEGRGLSGTIDVEADMGAVSLEIASLDRGKHRVRADMGSVRVELAKGQPVRIDARTSMGASRVDFPSTRDAAAILDVEADLGAVRICASGRTWNPAVNLAAVARDVTAPRGPYRDNARDQARSNEVLTAAPDAEVNQVLERVANGTLSPADAREILRAMGWS